MKKGDIAYKVVEKRTRLCTNLAIYRKYARDNKVLKLNKLYPLLYPRYRRGKVLKADKRTEGFFVFENNLCAKDFIYSENLSEDKVKIIRIKLLDIPKRPKKVLRGCGAYPLEIYMTLGRPTSSIAFRDAPLGCWTCHKVEVLD